MRSSVPKLFHPILLIIILMLRGTTCSAQYQFQVICQKEDGQQGTVIDGKHYVGNTILWGLSDSGSPLFGASTQENPTEGDIPSTLFLGSKAIAYNGVTIDSWAMIGSGYGGSMASDGTVTFNAGLDTTKTSDQQQKAFKDKYLPNYLDCYYIQVAAATSEPHIIPQHNASLPGMNFAPIPKNQQMSCKFFVEGSRLTFDLRNPSLQLSADQAIKEQLKTPITVDWSKLLGGTVTAAQTYLGYADTCIINKRGQILLSIIFTRGNPKQNAGQWRNYAIILGTPTNAFAPEPDKPMAGDIVVYRGKDKDTGAIVITHSGVIVKGGVLPDGTVTEIESKWGTMGLYIHDPNDSIYGKSWTVWRANRKDGSHSNLLIRRRYTSLKFIHSSFYYTDRAINQRDNVASSLKTQSIDLIDEDDRDDTNKYMATRNKNRYPVFTVVEGPTGTFNCHGYTFTNGSAYVPPEHAQRIINDDGYYQIKGARDTDGKMHLSLFGGY